MHLFRHIRKRLVKEEQEFEFTFLNSGLSREQMNTAAWAMKWLGLENKRSCMSRRDLMRMCYGVGLNPTDDVVESKLRSMNIAESSSFSMEQFAHLWHGLLCDGVDEKKTLERAFYFFDRDGNGEISITELKTTMRELGDLLSEEEIQQFCSLMDKNNDGVIDYAEFIGMLQSQVPLEMGSEFGELDVVLSPACHIDNGNPSSGLPPTSASEEGYKCPVQEEISITSADGQDLPGTTNPVRCISDAAKEVHFAKPGG